MKSTESWPCAVLAPFLLALWHSFWWCWWAGACLPRALACQVRTQTEENLMLGPPCSLVASVEDLIMISVRQRADLRVLFIPPCSVSCVRLFSSTNNSTLLVALSDLRQKPRLFCQGHPFQVLWAKSRRQPTKLITERLYAPYQKPLEAGTRDTFHSHTNRITKQIPRGEQLMRSESPPHHSN